MKGIDGIINIINKNNSTEAKLLAYEVLAYMQERERFLQNGVVEDSSGVVEVPPSQTRLYEIKEQPTKEKREEPEDLTEELVGVIQEDVKMPYPPPNFSKSPSSPSIPVSLMDKLKKRV